MCSAVGLIFRKFDFVSPWEGMTDVMLPGDEKAAKQKFGAKISDINTGHASPYFKFMADQVDHQGSKKSALEIMQRATSLDSFDLYALQNYFARKAH